MSEVVKVQLPLGSDPPGDDLALVYGKGRKWMARQPLDHATKKAMGDDVKAYFEAQYRHSSGTWLIGKRVKDRDW